MDRYDPYTDKFLRDTQYGILGTNLAEVGTDCISRQAAIDALTEDEYSEFWDCIDSNIAADIIRRLPSAQPEPKRGRWTGDNACSECGYQPWFSGDIHNYSFCPNCGADMRQ